MERSGPSGDAAPNRSALGAARSLSVRSLSVRHFRNLSSAEMELGDRFNVVSGDNGQGKTNVLEAIYVLATSRSFRTSRLSDMIERGAETASLRGTIVEDDSEREQRLGLRRGLRAARIDGKRPPTLAAYAVSTPTVAFHPGSSAIAGGGGSERRKVLDRLALYLSPSAMAHAESYGRATRARQRVLDVRGPDAADLGPWEDLMIRHGTALGELRRQAASRLAPRAESAFARLGGQHALEVRYAPGFPEGDAAFRAALEAHRVKDRARGSASVGPHRGDLVLSLGGVPVRGMASQGQQRAAVLAIEIAEIELIAEIRGVVPVLLLDDVSSELDRSRMGALVATLLAARGQVVLTTTRPEWVDEAGLSVSSGRSDFVVRGGHVSRGAY